MSERVRVREGVRELTAFVHSICQKTKRKGTHWLKVWFLVWGAKTWPQPPMLNLEDSIVGAARLVVYYRVR